jgi:GNAT superfamily N-acetyltransferase
MLGLVDRLSNSGHAGSVNRTQVDGTVCAAGAAASADIRPVRGSDREAIRDFLAGLSLRTRYLRFFGAIDADTPAMVRLLAGSDPAGRPAGGDGTGRGYVDALVATEDGTIVGHGMASDGRDPSGARVSEMGVVVADAWQGKGVGTTLTRALAARARARGAAVIVMDVLAENRDMLGVIARNFPAARRDRSGPYVSIRVPLPRQEEASR